MDSMASLSKHGFPTRLVHIGLALTIIANLAISLVMEEPHRDQAGDLFFQLHRFVGIAAFFLSVAFWLVIFLRKRGTALGLIFPWFSSARLRALKADIKAHFNAALKFRLPAFEQDGALSSAVHGLGLLLMTLMALTGAIFGISMQLNSTDATFVRTAIEMHEIFANLVWAYLIAHLLMAILHQYLSHMNISEMWSLRRK